ncbi:unnamed protein product [Sympodiomycopsis kandeliae]
MKLDLSKAADAPAGGGSLTLPLLKLISEARNEHGMRQHDYASYRHFCTQKTYRLRKTLNLTHKDAERDQKGSAGKGQKNNRRSKRKQTAASQSAADKAKGGNVFTEKTIDVGQIRNDRPAQLLLFEAERAWSHAQDLRNQSNEQEQDPSLRKRGLGRAKRSVQWAQELADLIQSLGDRVDASSKVEVAIYSILTKSSAAFDKGEWQSSLEHLSVARHLLAALALNSADSRGEALANSFIDAGEAQMRFCAYQIGEEGQDMDEVAKQHGSEQNQKRICPQFDQLIASLEQGKAAAGQTVKEDVRIRWRDRTIPIRNPELMDAVVSARSQEDALANTLQGNTHVQDTSKAQKRESSKPKRLSHAERSAKKRGGAAPAGETSTAAAKRAVASSRSTNDPFDHAIAALTEGEVVARRLVEDNAEALSKSHSTRYEAVGEDLKVAHEWLQYRLLSLQIKRSTRLISEVQDKAQKREIRKKEQLERKLAARDARSSASVGKSSKKSSGSHTKKEPKKPQPGSLAKRPRSGPVSFRRKPAKSGTKRLQALKAAGRDATARVLSEGQSRRRSARAIPAIAKLLDNSEYNLIAISALSVIEGDPDASSLIDAKAAWYRAELLRQLARAHALANERGEASLLLRRAALSVRQARQALELVEEEDVIAEVDSDVSPALSEELLSKTEAAIDVDLRQTQREAFLINNGRSPFTTPGDVGTKGKGKGREPSEGTAAHSLSQTKAGQQLRMLAGKHVDFDPVDVEEASRPDPVYEEELEAELEEIEEKERSGKLTSGGKAKKAVSRSTSQAAAAVGVAQQHASSEEEHAGDEHFEEAAEDDGGASTSDDEFAPADEHEATDQEDEDGQEGAGQKKGWFGGWFGGKK